MRMKPSQLNSVRVIRYLGLFVAVCALSSCAHQPSSSAHNSPGFVSGLLHGFLVIFSFIGSLFSDVRIYAFPNSGRWYDLGFLIGAGMCLGAVV